MAEIEQFVIVPPITIGELTDVPAPGSGISAAWAQEVSGRVRHRFANIAARDAQWPAATAGAGAQCVTLNDNRTYTSDGTIWRYPPGTVLANATAVGADANVGGGAVTQDVITVSQVFTVPVTVTVSAAGWYGFGGVGFTCSWDIAALNTGGVLISRGNLVTDATWKQATLQATWIVVPNVDSGFKMRWSKDNGQIWRGATAAYLVTA
jgi:hypothetical protein